MTIPFCDVKHCRNRVVFTDFKAFYSDPPHLLVKINLCQNCVVPYQCDKTLILKERALKRIEKVRQ